MKLFHSLCQFLGNLESQLSIVLICYLISNQASSVSTNKFAKTNSTDPPDTESYISSNLQSI